MLTYCHGPFELNMIGMCERGVLCSVHCGNNVNMWIWVYVIRLSRAIEIIWQMPEFPHSLLMLGNRKHKDAFHRIQHYLLALSYVFKRFLRSVPWVCVCVFIFLTRVYRITFMVWRKSPLLLTTRMRCLFCGSWFRQAVIFVAFALTNVCSWSLLKCNCVWFVQRKKSDNVFHTILPVAKCSISISAIFIHFIP